MTADGTREIVGITDIFCSKNFLGVPKAETFPDFINKILSANCAARFRS
jgi:hypothetical protein